MKRVRIVKSYNQWSKILDTMINGAEEFYILYGAIESKLYDIDHTPDFDKRHPIPIDFELTIQEFNEVKDTLKQILNNTY